MEVAAAGGAGLAGWVRRELAEQVLGMGEHTRRLDEQDRIESAVLRRHHLVHRLLKGWGCLRWVKGVAPVPEAG